MSNWLTTISSALDTLDSTASSAIQDLGRNKTTHHVASSNQSVTDHSADDALLSDHSPLPTAPTNLDSTSSIPKVPSHTTTSHPQLHSTFSHANTSSSPSDKTVNTISTNNSGCTPPQPAPFISHVSSASLPVSTSHPSPSIPDSFAIPTPADLSEVESLRSLWMETREQLQKCHDLLRKKKMEYNDKLAENDRMWEQKLSDLKLSSEMKLATITKELNHAQEARAIDSVKVDHVMAATVQTLETRLEEMAEQVTRLEDIVKEKEREVVNLLGNLELEQRDKLKCVETMQATIQRQADLIAELTRPTTGRIGENSDLSTSSLTTPPLLDGESLSRLQTPRSEDELKSLQYQLESYKRESIVHTEVVSSLEHKLRDVEGMLRSSESAYITMEKDNIRSLGEIARLGESLAQIQQDKEHLASVLSTSKQDYEANLQVRQRELDGFRLKALGQEKEIEQLKGSLSHVQVELANAYDTINRLEGQLSMSRVKGVDLPQQHQNVAPQEVDLKTASLSQEVLTSRTTIAQLEVKVNSLREELDSQRVALRDQENLCKTLEMRLRAELGDDYEQEVAGMMLRSISSVHVNRISSNHIVLGRTDSLGHECENPFDVRERNSQYATPETGGHCQPRNWSSHSTDIEMGELRHNSQISDGEGISLGRADSSLSTFKYSALSQPGSRPLSSSLPHRIRGRKVRDLLSIDSLRLPESRFRRFLSRLLSPCSRYIHVHTTTERIANGLEAFADGIDWFSQHLSRKLRHDATLRLSLTLYVILLHLLIVFIVYHFTHHTSSPLPSIVVPYNSSQPTLPTSTSILSDSLESPSPPTSSPNWGIPIGSNTLGT